MEKIEELMKAGKELLPDQILSIFEYVGQNGDVILINNDGLLKVNR